jgi:6-pyruvoyl-tetrahydropterin synthase related domain
VTQAGGSVPDPPGSDPPQPTESRPEPSTAAASVTPGKASRWYLVPCLLIVAGTAALIYWGFFFTLPGNSAIPPGVDPAHWITVSKAYVGQPYPSADFTLTPLQYPPLTFIVLGPILLLTGSPITTGYVTAGLLWVVFGLSIVHVARRFLVSGPFQVLFVGLALLNGTLLQFMFWGGYPNLLALALLNEALVFTLAFSRTRSTRAALLLYGMGALIYLTHSLTFAMFLATIGLVGAFLLAQDRRWVGLFKSRGNLYGLVLLAATVAAFTGITDALNIPHAGYLFSNPAAYVLDNLGELFHPLGYAPFWWPIASPIALDSTVMLAILFVAAAAVVYTMLSVRRRQPSWVPTRMTIALAALTAAILLPALGWVLHVDTDYPRFAAFFVVPLALASVFVAERFFRPFLTPTVPASPVVPPGAEGIPDPTTSTRSRRWNVERSPASWAVHVGVAVLLLLIFFLVSVPTVVLAQSTYASATHDSDFIQAMDWLRSNGTEGAVLADTSDTARWTEALANRAAYTYGDTWLHFYGEQILYDQQSYFAYNSHYAVSNNLVVVTMSGAPSNGSLNSDPGYTLFVEGVVLPILRINPANYTVDLTTVLGQNLSYTYSPSTWNFSGVTYRPLPAPTLLFGYETPYFWLNYTASAGPGSGANITPDLTARNGTILNALGLGLVQPEPTPLAQLGTISGLSRNINQITWNTTAKIGQLPTPSTFSTNVLITAEPNTKTSRAFNGYHLWFTDPTPKGSFVFNIYLTTGGTSNPAVTFPVYFDTETYFAENNIRFFVFQNTSTVGYTRILDYYESEFGFEWGYSNPNWTVLWLP